MDARGFGLSDVGRKRKNNEDAFWIDDELGAYVVCDGMGGHASGERAAATAIESVAASIRAAREELAEIRAGGVSGHQRLVNIAEQAVEVACREVHELASSSKELRGMGCTLTLLVLANDKGVMAHAGDTRLYLQRDGGVDQLSSDHTVAADWVREAKLTPEAARTHRYSSALTRALGPQATVQVESLILDVLPGDVFLLCSDGLSRYLESLGELIPFLMSTDLAAVPRSLIDLACERGGGDNVTAVVVSVTAREEERADLLHVDEGVRSDLASLRASRLFADMPYAHLLHLYSAGEVEACSEGRRVFEVGDPLEGLYCVLTGGFVLEAESGESETLDPGDHFAFPALLMRGTSEFALRARKTGRLLYLEGDRFQQLVASRPRVGLTLLSRMAQLALDRLGESGETLGITSERRRSAWWNPLAWARGAGAR